MSAVDQWVDTWDPEFIEYFNQYDTDGDEQLTVADIDAWKSATG